MEKEEQKRCKVRKVYTEIMRKAICPGFQFPRNTKADKVLDGFVIRIMLTGFGNFNEMRIADYCISIIHKDCKSKHILHNTLAHFGETAWAKYIQTASEKKTVAENLWLKAHGLNRDALARMITDGAQPDYLYMESEERPKRRFLGTDAGFLLCLELTTMWSPYSAACRECNMSGACKGVLKDRMPNLYQARVSAYENR